ncbi:nuclear transport factor 2 family protein [Hoeflea sp. TYP-13]|uniref:nuclear transport factor 2 family protein n=1 Tax=Hoeflea sp. TYP-13 TaxID=3230023 RepID=UPI0034C67503
MLEDKKVIAANHAFYAAYRFADFAAMDSIWSKREDVALYGPGGRVISGHRELIEHWRLRLEHLPTPDIQPKRPTVFRTRSCAMVICAEAIDTRVYSATNIFAKEDGRWLLTHHHTSGPSIFRIAGHSAPRTRH